MTDTDDSCASVLIVGGGPVGMCLAIDLAWRGVSSTIIEQRAADELPSVKCNHVAARTMEAFRRLGFVEQVRDHGLPPDYPHDVAFRTTTTGIEFSRIPIPARQDRYTSREGPDTNWPTPEPPHRINQIYLEPVIAAHARSLPEITVRNQVRCTQLTQDDDAVTAVVEDLQTAAVSRLRSQYLVGCDGGSSIVRKAIGASFHGDAVILRVQSTYIKAPRLIEHMRAAPAWGTFSMNPRRSGMVYAIDGVERWLVHNYLRDEEPDFESVDRDQSLRTILGVDDDFEIEYLSQEDWYGRRLVADRFTDRRVFMAGDSAHLWVPYAGYGMNAGIADALDLSWMLAATLQGWGGPELLSAYEAERLPITEQVSHYAVNHALAVAGQRRAVPPEIEDDGPTGDSVRLEVGRRAHELNVEQYAAAGLNFGYYYADSPVIAYDGDTAPAYSMGQYTPSTVPGCRAPHLWLSDGRSLYDALGPGYTLLCPSTSAESARAVLDDSVRDHDGVPVDVVALDGPEADALYGRRFVLVRPDQHVAWRGESLPTDLDSLLRKVTGWARPVAGARP